MASRSATPMHSYGGWINPRVATPAATEVPSIVPPVALGKVVPAAWRTPAAAAGGAPGAAREDPMVEVWQPVWAPAPGNNNAYGGDFAVSGQPFAIPPSELHPYASSVIAVAARPGFGPQAPGNHVRLVTATPTAAAAAGPYAAPPTPVPAASAPNGPPIIAATTHAPPQQQYHQHAYLTAAQAQAQQQQGRVRAGALARAPAVAAPGLSRAQAAAAAAWAVRAAARAGPVISEVKPQQQHAHEPAETLYDGYDGYGGGGGYGADYEIAGGGAATPAVYIPTPAPLAARQGLQNQLYMQQQQAGFGVDTSVPLHAAAGVVGTGAGGGVGGGAAHFGPPTVFGVAAAQQQQQQSRLPSSYSVAGAGGVGGAGGWVLDRGQASQLAAAAVAPIAAPPRAHLDGYLAGDGAGAGAGASEAWWGHPGAPSPASQYDSVYAAANAAPARAHLDAWQAPPGGSNNHQHHNRQQAVAAAAGAAPAHRAAWEAAQGGVAGALHGPVAAGHSTHGPLDEDDRWARDPNRPLQRNATALAARARATQQQHKHHGQTEQAPPQVVLSRIGSQPERIAVAAVPAPPAPAAAPAASRARAQTPPRPVPVPAPPAAVSRPGSHARARRPGTARTPAAAATAAAAAAAAAARRVGLEQQRRRADRHNHITPAVGPAQTQVHAHAHGWPQQQQQQQQYLEQQEAPAPVRSTAGPIYMQARADGAPFGGGHNHSDGGGPSNSGGSGSAASAWLADDRYTPLPARAVAAAAEAPRVVVALDPSLATESQGGLHGPFLRARGHGNLPAAPAGATGLRGVDESSKFYLREPPVHTEPGPYWSVDRFGRRCFVGAPIGLGSLYKRDRGGDATVPLHESAARRESSARPRENPRSASARAGAPEGAPRRVVGERVSSHQNNAHFNLYD